MKIFVDDKKMQFRKTALILASEKGHLGLVNRLLDCKEIDVNLQDPDVSENAGLSINLKFSFTFFAMFYNLLMITVVWT